MKIKINFFAVMLFLSMLISNGYYALLTFLCAALHESAHIIAAKARKIKLNDLNIGILGARLSMPHSICSYKDEIIICIAGPLINIFSVVIALLIKSRLDFGGDLYEHFILSSLALGVLNLLPIKTFDGGRILFAFTSYLSSPKIAEGVLSVFSFVSLFVLWAISVYLILKTSSSLSLFVFSVSLFANFFHDAFEQDIKKLIN